MRSSDSAFISVRIQNKNSNAVSLALENNVFIILSNDYIILTEYNAFFFTEEQQYKQAGRLTSGDSIYYQSNTVPQPIKYITTGLYVTNSKDFVLDEFGKKSFELPSENINIEPPIMHPHEFNHIMNTTSLFQPYGILKIHSPYSGYFIPQKYVSSIEKVFKPNHNVDLVHKLQVSEQVIETISKIYSDVIVRIIKDNALRACSFFMYNGSKLIEINSALVFNYYIKEEALSLIISHELGHFFGGPPFYPLQKMSCEGQADYYAAAVVMKKIWKDCAYEITEKAINQLHDFFKYEQKKDMSDAACLGRKNLCDAPCAKCRLKIYEYGRQGLPKPECMEL